MHYLRTEAWHRARMQALARKERGFIINPYAFATGGGGVAGTISLLHFNGTHGSGTFTDETGKTWTRSSSGAYISTADSVFGGASGSFDEASYISTPDHTDWDFGSGDFTLQGRTWFFSVAGGSNYPVVDKPNVASGGYAPFLIYKVGTGFYLYLSSTGSSWDIVNAGSFGTVTANTWYAWSVSRQGTSIYQHLDGILTNTITSSAALFANSDDVLIGNNGFSAYYAGYIDEFRAIKGTGLYDGSNYTPDASQFVYP